MNVLYVAIAMAMVTGCIANDVDFKDCGSKVGKISKLDVTPCPSEPCVFKKGTSANATMTFTPSEAVTASKIKIYGVIGGFPAPFPFDKPDGCKDHGLTCPLKPSVEQVLKLTLDVKEQYPTLKELVVKVEFLDQNSNAIFCIEFPASVQ